MLTPFKYYFKGSMPNNKLAQNSATTLTVVILSVIMINTNIVKKEGILMKKSKIIKLLIPVVIILVIVLAIVIKSAMSSNSEIGKAYTNNGIEFTLNSIEFADAIDNWGGANDNYWKPLPADASRNQIANAMKAKDEDYTICCISYTAKNVSKSDITISKTGTINFDKGYHYGSEVGGLSYRVSEEGVWENLDNGLKLKKLTSDAYEFRAYIVVPKQAVEETDKKLTYSLNGRQYDLRKIL
jgi:hypothetical protein